MQLANLGYVTLRAYHISLPKHYMMYSIESKKMCSQDHTAGKKRRTLGTINGDLQRSVDCDDRYPGSTHSQIFPGRTTGTESTSDSIRLCHACMCRHHGRQIACEVLRATYFSRACLGEVMPPSKEWTPQESEIRNVRKSDCNHHITHAIQRSAACSGPQRAYVCPLSTLVKDHDELLHSVLLRPHDITSDGGHVAMSLM